MIWSRDRHDVGLATLERYKFLGETKYWRQQLKRVIDPMLPGRQAKAYVRTYVGM